MESAFTFRLLDGALPVDQIINIVNIATIGLFVGVIVIALLAFFRGLFRGWKYGTYRLLMVMIMVAVALLTLQPIVSFAFDFDVSGFFAFPSFNLNLNGQDVAISTSGTTIGTGVAGYIETLLKAIGSDLPPEELAAYAIAFARSLVSFVMLMVDAILIMTLGILFIQIMWHLAFKRFTPKAKRKQMYKKGKIWGGISSVIVSLTCWALLLSPLTSMVNSLNSSWKNSQLDEKDQTTLHTLDNDLYQTIDGVLKAYDNSIFAQVFFSWYQNQEGQTLDTMLVDYLTNASVALGEQEAIQVSFLQEFGALADVFSVVVQGGILSSSGLDQTRIPLLLTTSLVPTAIRGIADSKLVTGILPYGLTILQNIDEVGQYIKVGTGIDFSGDYHATLNELADIYDTALDSNLLSSLVDENGNLNETDVIAQGFLAQDAAKTYKSIFSSLDDESMRIFDALIESALTIQAYNAYKDGTVEDESQFTVADFLPAVTIDDFQPDQDGKPTVIPEAYETLKWGDIFADFFVSLIDLVNVSEEFYLAVCNAIPGMVDGGSIDMNSILDPLLNDFDKAKVALVGEPGTTVTTPETPTVSSRRNEGETTTTEEDDDITPLLGTEFLLNASPKLVGMLGSTVNDALSLTGDDAIDLNDIQDDFRNDKTEVLDEFRALLDVVGNFAETDEGKQFILHLDAMPGIYFSPNGDFVGIDDGLAGCFTNALEDLDSSRIASEIMPGAFSAVLEGDDSPIASLGVDLTLDFEVDNIGHELSNLITTVLDCQDLLAYLISIQSSGAELTGGALRAAVDTIKSYSGELADFLVAVSGSKILNPVIDGRNNSNIVSLLSMVFDMAGMGEMTGLSTTLSNMNATETAHEMQNFVRVLVDVLDSGIINLASGDTTDLSAFTEIDFETMFANFDQSVIFSENFGSMIDSLLKDVDFFSSMMDEGLSFENVTNWREEGANLNLLINSVNELGGSGLLDGGSIDLFSSDPGAVRNILSSLAESQLFVKGNVSESGTTTYDYLFPNFVASLMDDYLGEGSTTDFFRSGTPGETGAQALSNDIRSTAVTGVTMEAVEEAQQAWVNEATTLSKAIRDILSLGGLDSLTGGSIDIASFEPVVLESLLNDAAELDVFGRVLNYSVYAAIGEAISDNFTDANGLVNVAALWSDSIDEYVNSGRAIIKGEGTEISKLAYALLDEEAGLIDDSGNITSDIDINSISPELVARPLFDALSSSRMFNSLVEGKEATAYEAILNSMLSGSLLDANESLETIKSVRGNATDFASIKASWKIENDSLVNILSLIQASDLDFEKMGDDPLSFFAEGTSYEGQRVKLENVMVAASDSKIVRPALASLVETASDNLSFGGSTSTLEVNSGYLETADSAEYTVEARRLSYVMMYGSMVGSLDFNGDLTGFLGDPSAQNLIMEISQSYVFNTLPSTSTSEYTAFETILYDAMDSSNLYLFDEDIDSLGIAAETDGGVEERARLDYAFALVNGDSQKSDTVSQTNRFSAWRDEVQTLFGIADSAEATGVDIEGNFDVETYFEAPAGTADEEAYREEQRVKLEDFLDSTGESNLFYPSLAMVLEKATVSLGTVRGGIDVSKLNFYYPGRVSSSNSDPTHWLLNAPYDSEDDLTIKNDTTLPAAYRNIAGASENEKVSYAFMYIYTMPDSFSIEEVTQGSNTHQFLRYASVSKTFNSLEGEDHVIARTDTSDYHSNLTCFEDVIVSSIDTSDYYLVDGEAVDGEQKRLEQVLTIVLDSASAPGLGHGVWYRWFNEVDQVVKVIEDIAGERDLSLEGGFNLSSFFTKPTDSPMTDDEFKASQKTKLSNLLNDIGDSYLLCPGLSNLLSSSLAGAGSGFSSSLSLSNSNFFYKGRGATSSSDPLYYLCIEAYDEREVDFLATIASEATALGSDTISIESVDADGVATILATMAKSRIFNTLEDPSDDSMVTTFASALATVLTSSEAISGYFYLAENPKDQRMDASGSASLYTSAESKAYYVSEELFPSDISTVWNNETDVINGSESRSLLSIIKLLQGSGSGSDSILTILGNMSNGLPSNPYDRQKITDLLVAIDGNALLMDVVPNAIREMTSGGSAVQIDGIDLSRADAWFSYYTDDRGDVVTSPDFLKGYGSEEINDLMSAVYSAVDNASILNLFSSGIGRNAITSLRTTLSLIASSKVLNGPRSLESKGNLPTISYDGTEIAVPNGLTVFQQTVFMIMVETSIFERAYDAVLDGEKGYVSAADKLYHSLKDSTATETDSLNVVDQLVSNGRMDTDDTGTLATAHSIFADESGNMSTSFSGSGSVFDVEHVNPDNLARILTSLNELTCAPGVVAKVLYLFFNDTINLGQYCDYACNVPLEGMRLSGIDYVGTSPAPTLYFYMNGSLVPITADTHGHYTLRNAETSTGDDTQIDYETSLIGPANVYLDQYGTSSIYDTSNVDDFTFVYDTSNAHLLSIDVVSDYTIPTLKKFLDETLWQQNESGTGQYKTIDNATDFINGTNSGTTTPLRSLIGFFEAPGGLYSTGLTSGGRLIGDTASMSVVLSDSEDLAFTSGEATLRNFLKIIITVIPSTSSSSEVNAVVDIASILVHEEKSDPFEEEISLISAMHDSLYKEATDTTGNTFTGGLDYLSTHIMDIASAKAYVDLATGVYVRAINGNGLSDTQKTLLAAASVTDNAALVYPMTMDNVSNAMYSLVKDLGSTQVSSTSIANHAVTSLTESLYSLASSYVSQETVTRSIATYGYTVVTTPPSPGSGVQTASSVPGSASSRSTRLCALPAMPEGALSGGISQRTHSFANNVDLYRDFYALADAVSFGTNGTALTSVSGALSLTGDSLSSAENALKRILAVMFEGYVYEMAIDKFALRSGLNVPGAGSLILANAGLVTVGSTTSSGIGEVYADAYDIESGTVYYPDSSFSTTSVYGRVVSAMTTLVDRLRTAQGA